jgi:hypothetical protein
VRIPLESGSPDFTLLCLQEYRRHHLHSVSIPDPGPLQQGKEGMREGKQTDEQTFMEHPL